MCRPKKTKRNRPLRVVLVVCHSFTGRPRFTSSFICQSKPSSMEHAKIQKPMARSSSSNHLSHGTSTSSISTVSTYGSTSEVERLNRRQNFETPRRKTSIHNDDHNGNREENNKRQGDDSKEMSCLLLLFCFNHHEKC